MPVVKADNLQEKGKGLIIAVAPAFPEMMNTLLSMSLPRQSSELPRRATGKAVAVTGNDVPIAVAVKPVASSTTPGWKDSPTAPRDQALCNCRYG